MPSNTMENIKNPSLCNQRMSKKDHPPNNLNLSLKKYKGIRNLIGRPISLVPSLLTQKDNQNYDHFRVEDIDWNLTRPIRGGVIICNIDPSGEIYFGLGVDEKTGELTDFGGGIKYRQDSSPIHGALRELTEETLSVFGYIDPKDPAVQKSPIIVSSKMMIMFIRIEISEERERVSERFRNRVKYATNPEIKDIIWLNLQSFKTLILTDPTKTNDNLKIYQRVADFIRNSAFFRSL